MHDHGSKKHADIVESKIADPESAEKTPAQINGDAGVSLPIEAQSTVSAPVELTKQQRKAAVKREIADLDIVIADKQSEIAAARAMQAKLRASFAG